jgi:hypothetical protein
VCGSWLNTVYYPCVVDLVIVLFSQKIGPKYSIKIVNGSFEDVAKFKNLVTTLTDKIACSKGLRAD